jgi:hypothetical protein
VLRVSIMQPYFLPYAGYFRLLHDVDIFVALDDVQFLRRGWMHRNRLQTAQGGLDWLTVPFAKGPQQMLITELRFQPDATSQMSERMRRFPACVEVNSVTSNLVERVALTCGFGVDYLLDLLRMTSSALGQQTPIVRSSELSIPPEVTGANRIYEICRQVGARIYYNAPGGRDLYSPEAFAERGIDLRFHPPYRGPTDSILQRLHTTDPATIRREIEENMN